MSAFTATSLFTGIGGIDLAFALAGFNVVTQVEIDPYCRRVLAKHAPAYWPNAMQFEDVRNAGIRNAPPTDVIFGGFPCQDISVANNAALGLEGERSGLWREFARIVGELRPRVVFLENVPAITFRGGVAVVEDLAALGYVGQWGLIPATDAGASHRRFRWFAVAYANSVGEARPRGERRIPERQDVALAGAKSGFSGAAFPSRQLRPRHIRDAQSGVDRDPDGLPAELDGIGVALPYKPQYPNEPPRTVSADDGYVNARLQALGNAVVPQVIYPIALEIRNVLEREREYGLPSFDGGQDG